ncbi:MAG: SpoIVB peptidase [Clostridia bacterium]|nr:SpoIVB peptidase [Oscillospiraceae bacterium]MBQ6702953.1 SpoIVB peptidase [Clostridia bacterium]
MQSTKRKIAFRIIFIICIVFFAATMTLNRLIPDSISVFANISDTEIKEEISLPFITATLDTVPQERVSYGETDEDFYVSRSAEAKIFGIVPIKQVNIDVYKDISLYPGGMPFGVKLYTDGVIVAGITGVETTDGTKNPAADGGLKVGDIIKKVDESTVNTTEEISSAIEQSGGKELSFTVLRNSKEMTVKFAPLLSQAENKYKAGIWLRDSTAGLGTVTFISPQTNTFAGLGHGICDVDTGDLMPLRRGTVVDVTIKGITKGASGKPGELRGAFAPGRIGSLIGNTMCGVYGVLSEIPDSIISEPLKIGLKDELKTGDCEIICTVNDKTDRYSAKIVKIGNKDADQKNFVIKITDKRLLDATGGIVQGMSGSPIIQNGKLVGAVTHVLVNDPTKGYGIFIENMLKNMPEITE